MLATMSFPTAFKQSTTFYRQGMHLLADCKHLQAGQKQPKSLLGSASYLKHHLMSHLQIHWTAILTPYTGELGCGADLWFANLAFITTFYSLSTQWREKGLLQAESIAASSLLTTLHYHPPLTDTKQNPHSSFIGQIGSSRGWLTRICKISFLLSNLDYIICLGRGEWQQFSPPVISQEPKILEAQLQLPAARAASSAATKPFPWLPSEFIVVV